MDLNLDEVIDQCEQEAVATAIVQQQDIEHGQVIAKTACRVNGRIYLTVSLPCKDFFKSSF